MITRPLILPDFLYSVGYGGSNPFSMSKIADVICEIEGSYIKGENLEKADAMRI